MYGVRPEGNRWVDGGSSDCRAPGLGTLQLLSDMLVIDVLSYLGADDIARLACASRALYVFAHCEDVHKAAVLCSRGGDFEFQGSWRETWIHETLLSKGKGVQSRVEHQPIQVQGFYSDLLFRAHHVAHAPIEPSWLRLDNITRTPAASLSPEHFTEHFDMRGVPVLLTGAIADWAALGAWCDPDPSAPEPHSALLARFGDVAFDAGSYQMTLAKYVRYALTVKEDQPLLLFDPAAFSKAPGLLQDWHTPAYFTSDLFSLLGTGRPNHRWLIAGPTGSGSVWHVDPNATSAYNALVAGRKLWLMWPPGPPPPGVYASSDGGHVMQPMSIMEWCIDFYGHALKEGGSTRRAAPPADSGSLGPGAHPRRLYQTIASPGDVIFVPRGWWHAVLNLGGDAHSSAAPVLTMAVTENFCSPCALPHVLRFLRDSRGSVSGVAPPERSEGLFEEFSVALRDGAPGEYAAALEVLAGWDDTAAASGPPGAGSDDSDSNRLTSSLNRQQADRATPVEAAPTTVSLETAAGQTEGPVVSATVSAAAAAVNDRRPAAKRHRTAASWSTIVPSTRHVVSEGPVGAASDASELGNVQTSGPAFSFGFEL